MRVTTLNTVEAHEEGVIALRDNGETISIILIHNDGHADDIELKRDVALRVRDKLTALQFRSTA